MASGLGLQNRSDEQGIGLMAQAQQQYPILQGLGLGYKYNPGGGQGYMETWPSGEPGTSDAPRPKEFPMSGIGLEVYDPKTRPIDIMGDIASHHLAQTDPKIKAYYQQFAKSLTPDQRSILKDQYSHAVQNEGEMRSYDQWHEKTGLPAYFRGYAFDQWPHEFNQRAYTPSQRKMFDEMMVHLRGDPYGDSGLGLSARREALVQDPSRMKMSDGSTAKIYVDPKARYWSGREQERYGANIVMKDLFRQGQNKAAQRLDRKYNRQQEDALPSWLSDLLP